MATLQVGEMEIAWTCLHLYFGTSPPSDQYLCRAYLCQALLTVPTSADSVVRFLTSNRQISYQCQCSIKSYPDIHI